MYFDTKVSHKTQVTFVIFALCSGVDVQGGPEEASSRGFMRLLASLGLRKYSRAFRKATIFYICSAVLCQGTKAVGSSTHGGLCWNSLPSKNL